MSFTAFINRILCAIHFAFARRRLKGKKGHEIQKVYFIINPASGIGKHKALLTQFKRMPCHCDSDYSERPGHAKELAAAAASRGYDAIIAVGGDGTVNEVATALIGSDIPLGIIPTGSGNGFARHLGISTLLPKAIATIGRGTAARVDTMRIGDIPYLSVAGIGFDASVSIAFSSEPRRGLASYLKVVLQHLPTYKPQHYELIVDGVPMEREAFLITFANAAQYGNNVHIAPQAEIDDGYFDLCILKRFPPQATPKLVKKLLTKKIHESEYVETARCRSVTIKGGPIECHVDGDPHRFTDDVTISIVPASLRVLR